MRRCLNSTLSESTWKTCTNSRPHASAYAPSALHAQPQIGCGVSIGFTASRDDAESHTRSIACEPPSSSRSASWSRAGSVHNAQHVSVSETSAFFRKRFRPDESW